MLVTHQTKQTGNGFAITAGFGTLTNWVEENSFGVLSTEEVGPPVDPSLTAPVIYGSQSTTYGSRTVLLPSASAPNQSYILPANIGYRLDWTQIKGYNFIAAGGETVDLGELRNRTSGTQSVRIYGDLTPYKMQYHRWTCYSPEFLKELLWVVPCVGNPTLPDITGLTTKRVPFTDNWGGSGFVIDAAFIIGFHLDLRHPNNSFPNVAVYGSPNGVQVQDTAVFEHSTGDDGVYQGTELKTLCYSTGEFKASGLSFTNYVEENLAINNLNQTFSLTRSPIDKNVANYSFQLIVAGGQATGARISGGQF